MILAVRKAATINATNPSIIRIGWTPSSPSRRRNIAQRSAIVSVASASQGDMNPIMRETVMKRKGIKKSPSARLKPIV